MPNAEKRDLQELTGQLSRWFPERMPGAKGLAISNLREPSGTGFSSETLMFDLVWSDAEGDHCDPLVMRLEPTGFNIFPTYDVPLQYRVMKTLEDTDVPVPRMRWLEESPSLLGVPFYIMDHVEGSVPTDTPPYHQGGWVHDLPPERREALWWNGLDAMAHVHKLDWKGLGFESLDQPELGATPLDQQLKYYDDYFSWGMERSRFPATQAGLDYLYANMPADRPVTLCWGDSRLANQIFHEERCVAVIDWEMVHLGSPVEDLAWWLMADFCFSDGIGTERSEGFPSHAATVGRWEELTGLPANDLAYYEILALTRFTVHMGRIGLQLKHYGIFPQDSTFESDNLATQSLMKKLGELSG